MLNDESRRGQLLTGLSGWPDDVCTGLLGYDAEAQKARSDRSAPYHFCPKRTGLPVLFRRCGTSNHIRRRAEVLGFSLIEIRELLELGAGSENCGRNMRRRAWHKIRSLDENRSAEGGERRA
jgi:hypothetical protein